MISLPSMIQRAARLNPNGIATIYKERSNNWATLKQRIACLAQGLVALNLDEADRVAILSLNSDRFYESLFAIPWANYTIVPLNTRWALAENDYALRDSGARVLLFDENFVEQAKELLSDVDALQTAIFMGDGDCPDWALSYEQLVEANSPATISRRGGNDMAGIFYTGGTTGFPKGVIQSHQAIWASAMGAMTDFEMSRSSRYLHVAPMFHMADFAGGMNATLNCAANIILQSFAPAEVLATLSEKNVTHALLVPAMIKMVLNHPDATSTGLSTMQKLVYGASPMPAAVLEQCQVVWPSIGLVQAYGQTELAPVVSTLSAAAHAQGGDLLKSAGRPTVVSDVRIVNDEGVDCQHGVSGEIVVRGPHAMAGYWNKSEETAKALVDGWVFTGDAGYFDDDGYLYIVDRVKDMVVTGGENVFTTEVENAVISHESVQDVAVIGVPHEEWGEAVHAIVILHPGKLASEEEIVVHCRALIAGYKLPKTISFRDEPLPLSGAGKVLKTDLRKPYWAGREKGVN